MTKTLITLLGAASVAQGATIYTDATGDNFDGNAHMDIASVEVDSTATTISFTVTTSGVIGSGTDWGKYLVGISTGAGTGDTSSPVGNAWGRDISMADGTDAWIGSWVDSGGGAQAFTYGGGSWTQNKEVTPTIVGNSVSFTFDLVDLGLSVGQTIGFDVYTSGGNGGDGPNDALANPNQTIADWGDPYSTPASGTGGQLSFTIVPEPGVTLLGAFAGLLLLRRRR